LQRTSNPTPPEPESSKKYKIDMSQNNPEMDFNITDLPIPQQFAISNEDIQKIDVGYFISGVNIRYDFANFFGSVTFFRRFRKPGNSNKAAASILLQSIDFSFELSVLFFEIVYYEPK
jgi:hypothetical protein